jgi:DNA polymerase elongation subunit (family B)
MTTNQMQIAYDVECYPNYFLAAFKNPINGKSVSLEVIGENNSLSQKDRKKLLSLMVKRTTFGYNSNRYDLPMILAAMKGLTCRQLKIISDEIIEKDMQQWQTLKKFDLVSEYPITTIDLMQVAPGVFTSLKLYGGRMNSPRLQDLPYPPYTVLNENQIEKVKDYCVNNDLDTTIDLYNNLQEDLNLRVYMSKEYGLNLMSKGGAQIAEAIIQKKFNVGSNKNPPPNKVKYKAPSYIKFKSPQLNNILEFVNNYEFNVDKSGYVKLPAKLIEPITINQTSYKMGLGGLHDTSKNLTLKKVIDSDVVSYYPSIMINDRISPPVIGPKFTPYFRSIFNKRIEAKSKGEKLKSNSLKLILNSTFGKLSNRWSCMYDPEGMLAVTITGQLALLMLIETLEDGGCRVYSANTDGIVHEPGELSLLKDWQKITNFKLEHTLYDKFYSRDVNNYLALQNNGQVKTKGVFAKPGLNKNPAMPIVYEAVVNNLTRGIGINETIINCQDITKFLTVRTVKGGAEWKGEPLGKVVRWYQSTNGKRINYLTNGNKVPKSDGAVPMMQINNGIPKDLDFAYYIEEANSVLELFVDG